jgi:hypothetical protein
MSSDDPLSEGDAVMIWGLTGRTDLNYFLAAVVHPLAQSDAEADPRIGVLVHNFGTERVRVKPQNLLRVDKEGAATLADGRQMMPAMVMPSAPAPAPNEPTNLLQDMYESIEAPAPAPAAAAIPSSDHENPWDFSDSEDESIEARHRVAFGSSPGPDWTVRRCESACLYKTHTPPDDYAPNQTTGVKWPIGASFHKGTVTLWKHNQDSETANLVWHPEDAGGGSGTPAREDLINLACVSLPCSRREDAICMRFEHGDDGRSDTAFYWLWFTRGRPDRFLVELNELNVSLAPMPPLSADPPPDPDPPPKPVPADRRAAARATLRNMMEEHCPRPHYCIFCGSEGLYGDKCTPCGFYRGSFCFPPGGPLQKGDTYMGRKLAFVKWPWQGDPEAPYVRAGAAPEPDPAPAPE